MKQALILLLPLLAAACAQGNITRTEALPDSAWEVSRWISAADAPVAQGLNLVRAADGASCFLLTLDGPVKSARWMATGLGVFQIWVNGTPVGEEVLRPGFTHHEKTRLSFTYDVTAALKKGTNVFAAQVTPGWWADKIITPGGHDGMVGRKCVFRSVLEVTWADGSTQLIGTDTEHWKAGIAGPVQHAGIFDGEEYDAREPQCWDTPEKLSAPEVNTEFKGQIFPSDGAEVYLRNDLTLSPVEAYVWEGVEDASADAYGRVKILRTYNPGEVMELSPGETLVVDFGQNCSAVPSFRFKAAAGTRLTCLPGELLNDGNGARSRGMDGPEGSVHRNNLRIQDQGMRIRYTFADTPDYVTYEPRCSFFGYRYVSVTATAPVSIERIASVPVTSIAQPMETGTLVTGNPHINQIISNTVWGQRSNYLSVPTDCPQRDERLGWTADTQVFTLTGTYFARTDAFFHKWMRDLRDSQSETGGFPGVAPLAQYGNEKMRLGWADAGIIVPWTIWKQFGDTAIVEENWEAMERYIRHVADTRYDHNALRAENLNYQWADWLSCEALESCINLAFDPQTHQPLPDAVSYWNYLGASYWALDAGMMRDMAQASGRDAAPYRQMEAEAKSYLQEQFLDGKGGFLTEVLNTMQTPALFALKNHLVEGAAKEAMVKRLRRNFADHGNCLQTGFLGTSILMQTLTDNGMADIAWELLFQRKNPSWLYSIDNGATTIWERWNSYTREKGLGPVGMNSFNHYAYGSVCAWIWETAAGIAADPAAPGFRHIVMKPVPDRRLGSMDAVYRSCAGTIRSAWQFRGDTWTWTFTIPEGATATVTLPGERQSRDYRAGTYTVEMTLS